MSSHKEQDLLKLFIQNNDHPATSRPVHEWHQIETRIHHELELKEQTRRRWFNRLSLGGGICLASFLAAFVFLGGIPKFGSHSAMKNQTLALVSDVSIDLEDVVWEALIGEEDRLEEFEQAYVDVLEL